MPKDVWYEVFASADNGTLVHLATIQVTTANFDIDSESSFATICNEVERRMRYRHKIIIMGPSQSKSQWAREYERN